MCEIYQQDVILINPNEIPDSSQIQSSPECNDGGHALSAAYQVDSVLAGTRSSNANGSTISIRVLAKIFSYSVFGFLLFSLYFFFFLDAYRRAQHPHVPWWYFYQASSGNSWRGGITHCWYVFLFKKKNSAVFKI